MHCHAAHYNLSCLKLKAFKCCFNIQVAGPDMRCALIEPLYQGFQQRKEDFRRGSSNKAGELKRDE